MYPRLHVQLQGMQPFVESLQFQIHKLANRKKKKNIWFLSVWWNNAKYECGQQSLLKRKPKQDWQIISPAEAKVPAMDLVDKRLLSNIKIATILSEETIINQTWV